MKERERGVNDRDIYNLDSTSSLAASVRTSGSLINPFERRDSLAAFLFRFVGFLFSSISKHVRSSKLIAILFDIESFAPSHSLLRVNNFINDIYNRISQVFPFR